MTNFRKIVTSGIVALALAGCGQTAEKVDTRFVTPIEYHLRHYPIDQVFKDHDGWRVYFTQESDKQVREIKIYELSGKHFLPRIEESNRFVGLRTESANKNIMVYRDVKAGEKPYIEMVRFIVKPRMQGYEDRIEFDQKYVEIHLTEGTEINAGQETYGGKFKTHEQMKEVK